MIITALVKSLLIFSFLLGSSVLTPTYTSEAQSQSKAILSVSIIKQLPELKNGCEITSLTMLLQFSGVKISKLSLASELTLDKTPIQYGKNGQIMTWGDPNQGFVGDITGNKVGYAVYHKPLFHLLEQHIKSAVDLTGSSLSTLEHKLSNGYPIVVWSTANYSAPKDNQWVTWKSPTGTIKATFIEHCLLLVGYDQDYVFVNDPLTGKEQVKIKKSTFISGWNALGKQAISYGN
ncbi:MAG: peptidase C39-like family protein [Cohnella sp.]|nr:peptidase C39-like family protein [Cohnella sp.]